MDSRSGAGEVSDSHAGLAICALRVEATRAPDSIELRPQVAPADFRRGNAPIIAYHHFEPAHDERTIIKPV